MSPQQLRQAKLGFLTSSISCIKVAPRCQLNDVVMEFFFQRSRLLVRSFFSQTKFPLLAFNLPYEGFSDCLLVPQNELRPRDCEKGSKTQAGKRVPSINIDGKFKSEYNVVFTGFLFKLLKTVMFSPNKKVAN